MKILLSSIFLATLILSGCATLKDSDIVKTAVTSTTSTDVLMSRAKKDMLSESDMMKISEKIQRLELSEPSPVVWLSDKNEAISINYGGFVIISDNYYCLQVQVTVDGKVFLPTTSVCLSEGEWRMYKDGESPLPQSNQNINFHTQSVIVPSAQEKKEVVPITKSLKPAEPVQIKKIQKIQKVQKVQPRKVATGFIELR